MPTGRRRPSDGKSVIRWRWRWYEDRCTAHDGRGIGPNGESYPDAHGWDCSGCRWAPPRVAARHGFRNWLEDQTFDILAGLVPVDKPADNPGVIHKAELADLDVRKAMRRRAADYAAKHGVPVNLTCGDTVVETIFPPEVCR